MRQLRTIGSVRLVKVGVTLGVVLAAWLAVGAPGYWG